MPDVGVLNLQIHDDSEQAGDGLVKLAGALRAVKSATSGFSLSKVTQSIKSMVEGVRDSMPVVKQLSTLFNAINSFSKIKSFSVDTEQIGKLRDAVTGFNIGNAGSQMKALREALGGSWNTKSTDNAVTAMGKLQGAASGWQQSGTAATVSAVAKAIEKYAAAHNKLPNDSPFHNVSVAIQQEANTTKTAVEQIKQHVQEVKDAAAGDWRSAMNGGVQEVAAAYHSMIFKESKIKTSDYWSIGADITKGLQEGIEQGKSGVASASQEIGRIAHKTIADEVEVHSPSRVTHEIGENVAQGLANGMRDKVGEVRSAAQELTEAVKDAINGATIVEGTFANSAAEVRTATGAYDSFGRSIGKASSTMKNVSDTVQSIDYSKLNINDYVASPVESIMAGFRNAGNAIDGFKDRISTSIPVFQEYRDTVLGLESKKDIAGFSRKSTDELLAGAKTIESYQEVKTAVEDASASEEKLINTTEQVSNAIEKVGTVAQKVMPAVDAFNRPLDMSLPFYLSDGTQVQFADGVVQAANATQNYTEKIEELDEAQSRLSTESTTTLLRNIIDNALGINKVAKNAAESAAVFERTFARLEKVETIKYFAEDMANSFNGLENTSERVRMLAERLVILQDELDKVMGAENPNENVANAIELKINSTVKELDKLFNKTEQLERASGTSYDNLVNMTPLEREIAYRDELQLRLQEDIAAQKLDMVEMEKRQKAIDRVNKSIDKLREAEEMENRVRVSIEDTNAEAARIGQLDYLISKIHEAQVAYNELRNNPDSTQGQQMKAAMDIHKAELKVQEYQELQNMLRNVSPEVQRFAQSQLDAGVSASTLRSRLFTLDGELKEKKKDLGEAGEAAREMKNKLNGVKKESHGLGSAIKSISPGIYNLTKQFLRMTKMRMIRAAIRQIAEGFREGVQNVYQYSQAIGGSFAPAMDSAATALLLMKNSIGAMAAPLIEALIPALQTVVGWVVNAVNWFNQLFSLLAGKNSWTRAKTAITTAFEDQTKATRGASKAMKDLLADWDELNIIQSQSSGGGSGAGAVNSAIKPEDMFEEVYDFEESTKGVAQFIDSLGGVEAVVKHIGAAFLAWKLRKPFFLGLLGVKSLLGKIKDYIDRLKQTTNPSGQTPQTTGNEPSVKSLEPRTEAKQPETVKTETKRFDDQATKTANEKLENVNDNIKRLTDTTEQFKEDIKKILPDQTEFKNMVEPAKRLGTGNGSPFSMDDNIRKYLARSVEGSLPSGMPPLEEVMEMPVPLTQGSESVGLPSGFDIEVDVSSLLGGAVGPTLASGIPAVPSAPVVVLPTGVGNATAVETSATASIPRLESAIQNVQEVTQNTAKSTAALESAVEGATKTTATTGTGIIPHASNGYYKGLWDNEEMYKDPVLDGSSLTFIRNKKTNEIRELSPAAVQDLSERSVLPSEYEVFGKEAEKIFTQKKIEQGRIWGMENTVAKLGTKVAKALPYLAVAASVVGEASSRYGIEQQYGQNVEGYSDLNAIEKARVRNFGETPEQAKKTIQDFKNSLIGPIANGFYEVLAAGYTIVDGALVFVGDVTNKVSDGINKLGEGIQNEANKFIFDLLFGALNGTSKPSKSIQRGFNVLDPEILEMAREDAKANIPVSWSDSEVFNYLRDYWGDEGIAIFDEIIRYLNDLDEQLYGTWSWQESGGPVAAMEDVLKASYAGIVQGVSSMGIPNVSGLYRVDQTSAANGVYATGGYAGAADEADMEKAMRNGSKEANAELETQGNQTNQLLQALLRAIRNGINVNMAAGSGAGFTVQKAIDSTAAINGYTS